MILSIIIPVFKVEKYISKCLDSIYSQDTNKSLYEVIVVNDGTPDNSMKEVDKFRNNHNLSIYNQENKGLSAARNIGIGNAKGDYIWCIDSDDWIYNDSLDKIIQIARTGKYDIIASKLTRIEESSSKRIEEVIINKHEEYSGKEYLFNNYETTPTQRFIYKRSFLISNNLRYYNNILHEDMEYCPRALYLAKNIYVINQPIYYYLQRNGSITSSCNKKNLESLFIVYEQLVRFKVEGLVEKKDIKKWDAICSKVLLVLFLRMAQSSYMENNVDDFKKLFDKFLPTIKLKLWKILNGKIVKRRFYRDVFLITCFPKIALHFYKHKK